MRQPVLVDLRCVLRHHDPALERRQLPKQRHQQRRLPARGRARDKRELAFREHDAYVAQFEPVVRRGGQDRRIVHSGRCLVGVGAVRVSAVGTWVFGLALVVLVVFLLLDFVPFE